MNPATAFGMTFADELIRCGLREVVLAPGSRSTPLAMAFFDAERQHRLRLHVRIDERSASYVVLGLAKASRRPAAVLCTSGTAAANFHPAVIEADESGVPLLVLTADRPPELRDTGANQTIDQVKLYGSAVRWFCEVGLPERRPGAVAYWRSLACQAWAHAAGSGGGFAGPVHLNLAFREPLTPDLPGGAGEQDWPEPLEGRPGGRPWTRQAGPAQQAEPAQPAGPGQQTGPRQPAGPGQPAGPAQQAEPGQPAGPGQRAGPAQQAEPGQPAGPGQQAGPRQQAGVGEENSGGTGPLGRGGFRGASGFVPQDQHSQLDLAVLELEWTERGVVVCGDGDYDATALVEVAERAGWPVLAEPSSGARRGPNALPAYQYLLATPEFVAAHQPDVLVSAGRPGLSRTQMALLGKSAGRHVVITQGPGHWADPQRTATDITPRIRLGGATVAARSTGWLDDWRRADDAARRAVDTVLDHDDSLTEPRLARDLVMGLPEGALLWAGSSMPIRDIDFHGVLRADLRILASRGASGIDGTVSAAIGAALAYGGPAFALIGDLAFLHDAPGLALGPGEPRPDLCLIVVNNDGGGIFSTLEQAAFTGSFERLFGTPHGVGLRQLAAAFGLSYQRLDQPEDLGKALPGTGLRIVEAQTDRTAGAALRGRLREAAAGAVRAVL